MGHCVFGNISVTIRRHVYSLLPFDNTQGTSQVEGADNTHFLIIVFDPDQFQTCIYTSINRQTGVVPGETGVSFNTLIWSPQRAGVFHMVHTSC